MKRRLLAIVCGLIVFIGPLWAQQTETTKTKAVIESQQKGSQAILLAVGVNVPLFILPADAQATQNNTLGVGAAFGLQYQYFLFDHVSLGGSLFGSFATTLAGQSLFVAPISAHAAYWWGGAPMEYTAGLDLGMTVMRLSGDGMLTPFAKLGAGAYYKLDSSWSLGGQANVWFIPELHVGDYSNLTRYGAFLDVSVSAVYHF
jgi:hypothetical protein